jgi:hypothetical protein
MGFSGSSWIVYPKAVVDTHGQTQRCGLVESGTARYRHDSTHDYDGLNPGTRPSLPLDTSDLHLLYTSNVLMSPPCYDVRLVISHRYRGEIRSECPTAST